LKGQVEEAGIIIARAFISEARDFTRKTREIEAQLRPIEQEFERLPDLMGKLPKEELLRRLKMHRQVLRRLDQTIGELKPYANVVIDRGRELIRRFPEVAVYIGAHEIYRMILDSYNDYLRYRTAVLGLLEKASELELLVRLLP